MKKFIQSAALLLITVCVHAQTIINNKGTRISIDSSKWVLSGNNICNKNTGNVGVGINSPLSKLETGGSFGTNITTTNSNLTLNDAHATVVITGGTPTITLPSVTSCTRRKYVIVNKTNTARTLAHNGSDPVVDFAGNTIVSISGNTSLTLQSDGTSWHEISAALNGGDASADAFSNNAANTRVELSTQSDGTTVRTAGAEFVIKDDGRVGIGTNNPAASVQTHIATGTANVIGLRLEQTAGNSSLVQSFKALNSTTSTSKEVYLAINPTSNSNNGLFVITRPNNADLSLDLANGNLGLGQATPTQKFEIKGSDNPVSPLNQVTTNAIFRIGGNTNHTIDFGTFSSAPYGGYIQSHNLAASSILPLVINPSGGNLGVGINNPASRIESSGSFGSNITFTGTSLTLNDSHYTIVINGGTPTITLPAASLSTRRMYNLVNRTAAAVTLAHSGSDAVYDFNGNAITSISPKASISLQSDGTSWNQINNSNIQWTVAGNDMYNNNSGNTGIGIAPTAKLDVNGTTRIRTINTVASNTAVYPVYADVNGNIVKGLSNADISKYTTGSISNGNSTTLNLAANMIYRGVISVSNICGGSGLAEVYISTVNANAYNRITGITGFLNASNSSSTSATFTQASNNKINVTFPNYQGCADNSGDFDFDLSIDASGILTITAQNGTGSRTYSMSFKALL